MYMVEIGNMDVERNGDELTIKLKLDPQGRPIINRKNDFATYKRWLQIWFRFRRFVNRNQSKILKDNNKL